MTPTLNSVDWLPECLASVKNQTYPRIEHIVIDGQSTDGTVELLRSESRIVWRSEADSGQSQAINRGFELASGSIVTWLNADDRLDEGAVSRAVQVFTDDPSVGVVYGDAEFATQSGSSLWRPGSVDLASAFQKNPIPQPGSFIAKWVLDRVGSLDEDLNLAMDYDLWLRVLVAGISTAYIPHKQATFRVHPGSKTGSTPQWMFYAEGARVLEKAGFLLPAADFLGRAAADRAWRESPRIDLGRWIDQLMSQRETRCRRADVMSYARVAAVERLAPDHIRQAIMMSFNVAAWLRSDSRDRMIAPLYRAARRPLGRLRRRLGDPPQRMR